MNFYTTASGMPCNLKVAMVINPRVPSEPTNRLVKLYPAELFLKGERERGREGGREGERERGREGGKEREIE